MENHLGELHTAVPDEKKDDEIVQQEEDYDYGHHCHPTPAEEDYDYGHHCHPTPVEGEIKK